MEGMNLVRVKKFNKVLIAFLTGSDEYLEANQKRTYVLKTVTVRKKCEEGVLTKSVVNDGREINKHCKTQKNLTFSKKYFFLYAMLQD